MVLPSWTETPSDSDSTIGTDDGKHHVHLVRRVACGADGDTNTGQQDGTKQNLVYLWKWPLPHSEKSPALETWLPDSTPS